MMEQMPKAGAFWNVTLKGSIFCFEPCAFYSALLIADNTILIK